MKTKANDVQGIWAEVLTVVKGELNTPTFKTWFEHTTPLDIIDDRLIVAVQNDFARDWLESRYAGLLQSALQQVTGVGLSIEFTVPPSTVGSVIAPEPESPAEASSLIAEETLL
ncbi:hypothetical protein EG829_16120, partial [bacterium]|nr:hypothetical protein [bacterium]